MRLVGGDLGGDWLGETVNSPGGPESSLDRLLVAESVSTCSRVAVCTGLAVIDLKVHLGHLLCTNLK